MRLLLNLSALAISVLFGTKVFAATPSVVWKCDLQNVRRNIPGNDHAQFEGSAALPENNGNLEVNFTFKGKHVTGRGMFEIEHMSSPTLWDIVGYTSMRVEGDSEDLELYFTTTKLDLSNSPSLFAARRTPNAWLEGDFLSCMFSLKSL